MRSLKAQTGHLQCARTSIMDGITGSPTGREAQGDAATIVLVGVTPDQGGRENRPQGKGWQGRDDQPQGHAVRDAQRRRGLERPNWRAGCWETGTSGSEGGGWKSTVIATRQLPTLRWPRARSTQAWAR